MRRPLILALSLTMSTLAVAAPAAAHEPAPVDDEACPAPEVVVSDYDLSQFAASATLAATGCPAREQRQFPFWLSVTRYDDTSAHGSTRGVLCGPFRPSPDSGATYSCDVDVVLDHPDVEQAHYTVEATYPGPDTEETIAFEVLCISKDGSYGCELQDNPRGTYDTMGDDVTPPRASAEVPHGRPSE